MILRVREYPDRILRQCGRAVGEIDERIRQLATDMLETMPERDGLGLAAQQVGEALRMFTLVDPQDDKQGIVVINPEIEVLGDGILYVEEGCLSVPGINAAVRRADHVRMRFLDLEGEPQELELEGTMARAAQHEYDHIEGILFIDRLAPRRREQLLQKTSECD